MKQKKNLPAGKTGIKSFQKGRQPKPASLPEFKPNFWFAIISLLAGFLLYLNTIKHDYVLDDVGAITGNEYVMEGISGIPKILSVGMWHFDNVNLGYYRPLSMVTFAIENEFFPKNPHVSHLGNVLLYALTGFFLCLLLMKVFRHVPPLFSFMITLLFITHPVHTEVVANIKSRDEILAFLNLVIALFLFLQYALPHNTAFRKKSMNGKIVWLLLSCIFFYLSLLSKETAMAGLFLAPLMLFFTSSLSVKQCLFRTIPFLLVIFIFQGHKYAVLGTVTGVVPHDIVNYPYADAGTEFPTTFLIFLWCIRLVFFPHPLTYDYSYNQIPAADFSSPLVLLGVIFAFVLVYFGFRELVKKSPLALGVLIFCVTLFPALAFVFLRGGILAERFLYAPSLGFCVAFAWLVFAKFKIHQFRLEKIKLYAVPLVICSVILLLYAFKTISRNPVWKDNMTLFSTDVNTSSNSCQVRRHYGSELINSGMNEKNTEKKIEWFNKGVAQLKEALRINPKFGDAFFKMGVAYQTVKVNHDSAIYYYNLAIREAPGYAISYNNLGILYETIGKQELASYYYNKAVEVNPFFADGKKNSEAHKQKTGLDIKIFPTSVNLDSMIQATPDEKKDYTFYYQLGTDYASKGDYNNAIRCLEKSIELNPSNEPAMVNLSNCYGMIKNYAKNIEILNRVLALNPNNVQAYGNLAVTYDLMGNQDKAEEYKDKVRELTGK